ncbi:hypothetical protein DRN43_00760 [Thermococci archaeon]|uniref:DUF4389 domain-containing protein n=1 Tax=Palaeococcus sp. (in: euryarchaeotes) TaxID=2820298 RepID=UPI000F0E08A5|nr:DUF4389 domain-containing protein [Palaeococcus sp. (in: euryarchaeotes)]MCD6558405.1 DUF4389 domain-containing protein [Palaeococcus sp. (in: euryarchaeotes)]RLF75872.1 MAG: hypothetical protein DRN39_06630 [Thermococci archaeon]RLF90919.1 MAG: hypothetical protein DRN43_00760 [Thermococci archaeon]
MGERIEALVRIPLAILYGIITGIWGFVAELAAIVNWFYALIFGKRSETLADFVNQFVAYSYDVNRYLYMATNKRAWPIEGELRILEPTDLKKAKGQEYPEQL